MTENFDDVPLQNGRGEIELAEKFRHESCMREEQRRCVKRHFVGPFHHVAAEKGAGMVEELRSDQERFLVANA